MSLPCRSSLKRRILLSGRSYRRNPIIPVAASSIPTSSLSTTSSVAPPLAEKQKRIPRTLYRQLLRWCQATDPKIPLEDFIEPIALAPPQLDEEAISVFWYEKVTASLGDGLDNYIKGLSAEEEEAFLPVAMRLRDEAVKIEASLEGQPDSKEVGHLQKAYQYLPASVKMEDIDSERFTVSIQNTRDLKQLIQAMFRANVPPSGNDELNKQRVTFAFQAVRTLNELTEALDDLNKHRESRRERDEILFYVGQVVQHKYEKWRGVIMGWERPVELVEGQEPKPLSSLTTKRYTAGDFLNSVRYEVLLDSGDAFVMEATASMIVSTQDDLELVTDPSLCRIRSNMIPHHFKGYDARSNTFLMRDMLAYEYPTDHEMQQQLVEKENQEFPQYDQIHSAVQQLGFDTGNMKLPRLSEEAVESVAKDTLSKIKEFTSKIRSFLLEVGVLLSSKLPDDEGDPEHDEKKRVLMSFCYKLDHGVRPPGSQHPGHSDPTSPIATASALVDQLRNFCSELRQTLWCRKKLMEASDVHFELGQVVDHQYFGFRGVIVGIDHRPIYDVSRWDGVQHLDNPGEQPFYYILPDLQDCEDVFGVPKGMRYVCQENLKACEGQRRDVSIPKEMMDPGWSQKLGRDGIMEFVPPPEVKFKHGVDIGDNNLAEECLGKVESAISHWEVSARETARGKEGSFLVDIFELLGASKEKECHISILDLVALLRAAPTIDVAMPFDEAIKDILRAHTDKELRQELEEGVTLNIHKKHESALHMFESLVEKDSDYGEAWNKKATSECILRKYQVAVDSCKKAIELEPTNYQAFSGAGICEFDQGNYENAAALFRYSLELNPWSPISTKLAATIDMQNMKEKEGSGVSNK